MEKLKAKLQENAEEPNYSNISNHSKEQTNGRVSVFSTQGQRNNYNEKFVSKEMVIEENRADQNLPDISPDEQNLMLPEAEQSMGQKMLNEMLQQTTPRKGTKKQPQRQRLTEKDQVYWKEVEGIMSFPMPKSNVSIGEEGLDVEVYMKWQQRDVLDNPNIDPTTAKFVKAKKKEQDDILSKIKADKLKLARQYN